MLGRRELQTKKLRLKLPPEAEGHSRASDIAEKKKPAHFAEASVLE